MKQFIVYMGFVENKSLHSTYNIPGSERLAPGIHTKKLLPTASHVNNTYMVNFQHEKDCKTNIHEVNAVNQS